MILKYKSYDNPLYMWLIIEDIDCESHEYAC